MRVRQRRIRSPESAEPQKFMLTDGGEPELPTRWLALADPSGSGSGSARPPQRRRRIPPCSRRGLVTSRTAAGGRAVAEAPGKLD